MPAAASSCWPRVVGNPPNSMLHCCVHCWLYCLRAQLTVYDGDDGAAPPFAQSPSIQTQCGVVPDVTFASYGSSLEMRLTTDRADTSTGFTVTYSAVPQCAMPGAGSYSVTGA